MVLVAERGAGGFSMREVARRAGVSPGAPRHHFPDRRALLTGVAVRVWDDLAQALSQTPLEGKRKARIRSCASTYVAEALANPGRFALVAGGIAVDSADPDLGRARERVLAVLGAEIEGETPDARRSAAIALWSLVHGFAVLALDGAFGSTGNEAAERAAEALLPAALACVRL